MINKIQLVRQVEAKPMREVVKEGQNLGASILAAFVLVPILIACLITVYTKG